MQIRCIVHRDYLDVFKRGFLFRVHLHTDHEQLMLENSSNVDLIVRLHANVMST